MQHQYAEGLQTIIDMYCQSVYILTEQFFFGDSTEHPLRCSQITKITRENNNDK